MQFLVTSLICQYLGRADLHNRQVLGPVRAHQRGVKQLLVAVPACRWGDRQHVGAVKRANVRHSPMLWRLLGISCNLPALIHCTVQRGDEEVQMRSTHLTLCRMQDMEGRAALADRHFHM